MNAVLTVRLGSRRAAALRAYQKQTGLTQTQVIHSGLDRVLAGDSEGLPPTAARLCGSMDGPTRSATNGEVRKAFRR